MHESVAHLAPLIGIWRGQGHGEYPTIQSFSYLDEWEFSENGKPFVRFTQRTMNAAGQPMHTETGYLRCPAGDVVEIVAALPTGQAECGSGKVGSEEGLTLTTDGAVQNTASAKQVDRIVRRFDLQGEELAYRMDMAAVGVGVTLHLRSSLRRA